MIDNKVRYEIDGSGAFIDQTIGSVRALTDYTTTIELVSPLPRDTSVMVNFLVYDARNIDLPLFMIPSDKKGWQVSNNPLVADWNVWEVGIDQTALAAISKYRAGRIGVSFTFRERRPSKNALNYKGIFDEFNQLPLVGENDGDYYVCRGYNIVVSGTLYTYNDNAVWQTDKWVRDRNMRITLTTTTIDLPVDPALLANVPDVPAQDIADIIAQWGGGFVDMESHINDADIHVSPIDRDFWDGMLPRDGSESMEADLDLGGNKLVDVDEIKVDTISSNGGSYIEVVNHVEMTGYDIQNAETISANAGYIQTVHVDTIESNNSEDISVKDDVSFETGRVLGVDKVYVKEIHKRGGSDYIPIFSNIDMGGSSIYTIDEIESELGVFHYLTKGGKEVATLEYVDQEVARTLKPMGNWNASTNTPTLLATDIERANQVWYVNVAGTQFGIKFDVGDELVYSVNGEAFRRDNVDAVISVQGKSGAVTLVPSDIGAVEEALNNGKTYARKNKSWVEFQRGFLPDEETITLNGNDELEATNVAIWRYE